ncbi:LTA synthase family protein [Parablautia sp. Marseille-Q6255]|uniref:LTA synthase family protein n=1 Tax=Parablautia sp. Marseille-Q6255 TaxID=3039593 RepID=UPI0024BC51E4|nr:LTA synthase family protein [Parablautia sp. Marseille-Q6255]
MSEIQEEIQEKVQKKEEVQENGAASPESSFFRKKKKEIWLAVCRILGAGLVGGLLVWYCLHPEYYSGEDGGTALFESSRTYAMIVCATVLIALCLIPNRISEKSNRVIAWVWFAVSPFAIYFSLLYLNAEKFHIEFFKLNRIALFFTFWFLYLLAAAVLILFGSLRAAVIVPAVAVAVLGIANCFVIEFRGMALSGGDLFSINTAMTVVSSYEYRLDWFMFMELFLTVGICIISCKIRGFRPFHWKVRVILLCIWCIFAGTYYHICCRTSFLEDHDIRSGGFTHQLRYKQYDMLFTTLCTCFYMIADKPEGYSVEHAQEIAEEYIGTDEDREVSTPNLVVIMNESFADYSDIGQGLDFSEDCMPFIHGLTENTIKGTAYASIFGANTPNSEYEFLTGNTMGFLPETSVGFNVFVRGNMPSLASQLKNEGYTTLAMHPYRGTNYRRHIVYPQIGFDTYYDRKHFMSAGYIRRYISDEALYDRVIREFEKHVAQSDDPLLCYNVTIQNHGGYTSSNVQNLKTNIKVKDEDVDTFQVQQHANLIRTSDEAFQKLIEYFSTREEPVVVIMFGDHQASLGTATYEHLIGKEETLTAEERMEKYKVPFIAWANYDIEEEVIEKTSLNYLYSILADRLDLPMTGYQEYLLDLSEEIPVLAAGGYWTSDGDFYELDDESSPYFERVNEYNILEYNYIFGGNDRCMELFADAG